LIIRNVKSCYFRRVNRRWCMPSDGSCKTISWFYG